MSYAGPRQAVAIFCREPAPGQVKTRLAATVGGRRAAEIYGEMVQHTVATATACPGRPSVLICYTPPEAGETVRRWLGPGHMYEPQADGSLGDRMREACRDALAEGYNQVVIVGSDCPALRDRHLAQAFRALRHNDVVLGPTEDGGYYLIGAKVVHDALFDDIPWGTPEVLPRTMEALKDNGLRYRLLEKLRDLDDRDDLDYHRNAGHFRDAQESQHPFTRSGPHGPARNPPAATMPQALRAGAAHSAAGGGGPSSG
jgi:rSAM/selenodomain-associated transferase 1